MNITGANTVPVMFAPGDATIVQALGQGNGVGGGDGLGPTKPGATPSQGLGSGAGMVKLGRAAWTAVVVAVGVGLVL